MTAPDLVNGLFELGGSLAIMASVARVRQDKQVKGVSWYMIAFFTSWGAWNIFYYPHLGQTFSYIAGLAVLGANLVYLAHLLYYRSRS